MSEQQQTPEQAHAEQLASPPIQPNEKDPAPLTVRLASMKSLDPVALKWRALIERRRAHFIDLYLSGRWKRYYSEEKFQACFRETMSIADRWAEIAPKPEDNTLTQPDLPPLQSTVAELPTVEMKVDEAETASA